jgi:Ca2+-binding EF-hand superfamily protein
MFRPLALAAALLLAAPVAFAEDPKAEEKKADKKGKLDKEKLFTTMDADGDGKVGKDEFTKGMEKVMEKMKERAADKGGKAADLLDKLGGKVGGKLFDKLDADGDGKLTKEEFEKAEFEPGKLRELLGKGK